MLKVLQIIPSLKKGGAERLVLDMCNELGENNDVCLKLIVFDKENEYQFLCGDIDLEICQSKVIPSISSRTCVNIDSFLSIVNDFKPQIIHSHLFEAEMLSRYECFDDIVYVSHFHDNMKQFENLSFRDVWKKERITNYYEKFILFNRYNRCNNYFIANSKDTYAFIQKILPQFKDKIEYLPNAIDFNRFNSNSEAKNLSEIRMITIGSLVDKKNQVFLVDVVRLLKNKGFAIRFDLFGEGRCRQLIENKIRDYSLEKEIILHGNVDNVEDYLRDANVYVHSATYEPFGLVLLEAMAGGLPVVCLDGGGNRELIEEEGNGYLIDKPDANLFVNKVIEAISDVNHYKRLSNNAVAFARKYDIKEYVDKLISFYKSVRKSEKNNNSI